MATLTDASTKQSIADTLHQSLANLASEWTNINMQAHSWAYNTCVSMLAARGYTKAQIDASDQIGDYERSLTLWRALCNGGALQNLDKKFIDTFDLREDLKEVLLTASGVPIEPGGSLGLPAVGRESTANDIFQWPPNDGTDESTPGPGIGERTDW